MCHQKRKELCRSVQPFLNYRPKNAITNFLRCPKFFFWIFPSPEPKAKRIKLSKDGNDSVEFGMELVVYDKHQRCSLEDGIYEFVLGELENRGSNDKCARISAPFSTWEDLKEDKEQMSNVLKIDVSVNESYDGSYTGCPTMPFRPGWPMKRSSMTHVIVCHPKRTRTKSLSEFTEIEENDHENHRPYITGHNR
ncbi:unnamed protein product, partial [Nesidiocoris tenuis]